ncbi:hypothetical protein BASA83_013391 [Batrachochytrium salamandrivorans]|nr:hypothetical protein BASA83_013391 [Batrachochytrium salamandrivorans]
MASLEEILSSLSARLRLLENENEILKVDIQESRAIANRAILEHTITGNAHMSFSNLKLVSQTSLMAQERIPVDLSINSSSSFSFKRVDTTRIEKRSLCSELY